MNNLSEDNMIEFLLVKLRAEGSVTLNEFKRAVRAAFNLTPHDLSPSPSRPNELRYEQRCRNLYCHRKFPTEIIRYENQVFTLR
ncbi:hypothetical protein [uncultured Clostridium sp.]|uniref:hypothetical protein n=1 Tax=uncultured Clostridium sp. TaxID=59620 RepID=UPI0025CDDE9A|nr:hypothetical protein [uncultured Clostridium sp.]